MSLHPSAEVLISADISLRSRIPSVNQCTDPIPPRNTEAPIYDERQSDIRKWTETSG